MQGFNNLWTWMNSWKQGNAYGGFILHPIHGVVNFAHAKPVPSFTYLPLVRAFIKLSEKSEEFNTELLNAKEYLLSEINGFKIFNNSSFEFAPEYGTLIHNTFPVISLLKIAEHTRDENLLKLCKNLIERIIIKYWNGKDYTGVINQDLSAVEMIQLYNTISNTKKFDDKYSVGVANRALEYKRKKGLLRGRKDQDYMSPWYNSKMAESLFEIFKCTGDDKWLEQAKDCLNFTFDNFKKGLIHSWQSINSEWIPITTPKIIGASAYSIKVYYEVFNKIRRKEYNFLMKNQTRTGFFINGKGYGVRDYIGSLPWNCFNFELLALLNNKAPKIVNFKDFNKKVRNYTISEDSACLTLHLGDAEIFRVEKRTGEVIKGVIPKKSVNASVNDSSAHLLFSEYKRGAGFGFVDKEGNVYIDKKMGVEKFWKPDHHFVRFSKNDSCYDAVFKKRPERTAYYNLRKVLFKTPLFDLIAGTRK